MASPLPSSGTRRLADRWRSLPTVIHVADAEAHFRADEWLDAKSSRQPVIYISPNDIYTLHSAIVDCLDVVVRVSLARPLLAPSRLTTSARMHRRPSPRILSAPS